MSPLILILLLLIPFCTACPTGYTHCVWGQTPPLMCNVTGVIASGSTANSRYAYQESTGSIECSTTVFGDTAPGDTKQCCYQTTPLTGPVTPIVGIISCGGTINSYFKNMDEKHYWKLTTNSLNDVTYSTCNSVFDTRVHVYNDKGEIFSVPYCGAQSIPTKTGDDCNEYDCTSNNNNELFNIPSQTAGTYYIEVISYDNNENGNYQLAVSCDPIAITIQHLGCYGDGIPTRAMSRYFGRPYTIEECYNSCVGYKYFGMQYGQECYCEDNYNRATQYGMSSGCGSCGDPNCEMPGYGGDWANDVYERPTVSPTPAPTNNPTPSPTMNPTPAPTINPTPAPTNNPTPAPTNNPTSTPTNNPTPAPTINPTPSPTENPTNAPSMNPSITPSASPSQPPTASPSVSPVLPPSNAPSYSPSDAPSFSPSFTPSKAPTTPPTKGLSINHRKPTKSPTTAPITTTETISSVSINDSPQTQQEEGYDLSFIIIIAAIATLILYCICCGVFLLYCRKKQKKTAEHVDFVAKQVISDEKREGVISDTDATSNSNAKIIEMQQIGSNVATKRQWPLNTGNMVEEHSDSSTTTPDMTTPGPYSPNIVPTAPTNQQQPEQMMMPPTHQTAGLTPVNPVDVNINHGEVVQDNNDEEYEYYYDDDEDDDDVNEMYENHGNNDNEDNNSGELYNTPGNIDYNTTGQ